MVSRPNEADIIVEHSQVATTQIFKEMTFKVNYIV